MTNGSYGNTGCVGKLFEATCGFAEVGDDVNEELVEEVGEGDVDLFFLFPVVVEYGFERCEFLLLLFTIFGVKLCCCDRWCSFDIVEDEDDAVDNGLFENTEFLSGGIRLDIFSNDNKFVFIISFLADWTLFCFVNPVFL